MLESVDRVNVYPLTSVAPKRLDVGRVVSQTSVNAVMDGPFITLQQTTTKYAAMVCVHRLHAVNAIVESVQPANACLLTSAAPTKHGAVRLVNRISVNVAKDSPFITLHQVRTCYAVMVYLPKLHVVHAVICVRKAVMHSSWSAAKGYQS
jgi:hypothetical protein